MPVSAPPLFVDVDGVLSLFGFDHATPPAGTWALVEGIAHRLSATAGQDLLQLSARFELVWCTGWDDRANLHLPHLLGLGRDLPTLVLDDASMASKRTAIDAWAPGRACAWVDDRLDDDCAAWAAARAAPTLLVRTEPATGLGAREVQRLEAFAASLGGC